MIIIIMMVIIMIIIITKTAFLFLTITPHHHRGEYIEDNLFQFDQTLYMDFNSGRYQKASDISMDENGYVYVPKACQGNENAHCRLHVALHGCNQNLPVVGNAYAAHAGYNHWAEASSIVILYPYVINSESNPTNAKGCWDWWGYTGADYGLQTGVQMQVISNMIHALLPRMVTVSDRKDACYSRDCHYNTSYENGYVCSKS
jgi:hypothetical protein